MLHTLTKAPAFDLTLPRLTLAELVAARIHDRVPFAVKDLSTALDPQEPGVVILHGVSSSYYGKQLAQETARHTPGVTRITNAIEVAYPPEEQPFS